MDEPQVALAPGTAIITHKTLDSIAGLLVAHSYLSARKGSTRGVIKGFVPGHGGDIYFVSHDDDATMAVYGWHEMELAEGEPVKFEPVPVSQKFGTRPKPFKPDFEAWEWLKAASESKLGRFSRLTHVSCHDTLSQTECQLWVEWEEPRVQVVINLGPNPKSSQTSATIHGHKASVASPAELQIRLDAIMAKYNYILTGTEDGID